MKFSESHKIQINLHAFLLLGLPGGDLDLISRSGRSPGKGMATHSSVLAWRIPWTEESGGLQSMGSQRVRHD